MTYIPTQNGEVSSTQTNLNLATTAFAMHTGTLQAATSTTVTLAADASAADDYYNNRVIEIVNGTGIGQAYEISDYNGTTKVATISETLSIVPDTTSDYVVHLHSGNFQSQSLNVKNKLKLSSSASTVDDFYNECFLYILCEDGRTEYTQIIDYDGSTQTATIERAILDPPIPDSCYMITGESGTAQTATSNTITLRATGHTATDASSH